MLPAGLVLALLGTALALAGPLGTRAAFWSHMAGFAVLGGGALLGAAGAGLSILGAVASGEWMRAAPGALLGLAAAGVPAAYALPAFRAPAIHDITTDTQDPPQFAALLSRRAGAPNSSEYGGADVAAQQARAYPDIRPLMLDADVPVVFDRAVQAARGLGWEIVAAEPGAGRIEAVDGTFWFGFRDDVIVRVRAAPEGTRVDVRSTSRVGVGDAGANARRVRAFLRSLHDAFMSSG